MKKVMLLAVLILFQSCSRGPENIDRKALNEPGNDPDREWFSDLQPVSGEFPLHPDRPRLYLRPGDLDQIRERTRTTHREEWKNILAACKSTRLTECMLAGAFCYQVTGERNYARLAVDAALELSANRDRPGADLPNAYRVWPEAVVYDWCYAEFTGDERVRLLEGVKWQLEQAGGKNLERQGPHAGHLVNHLADAHLPAGIAFYDQDPAIWERALKVVRTQLAAKNVFYRYGASSQGNSYGITHFNGDIRLLMQLYKGTGVNLFERFPFYREPGYYWIYTRRPDGQLLRNGDDWLDDMNQNGWVSEPPAGTTRDSWTHPWLTQMLLYAAVQYTDPYLLGEYMKLRDVGKVWTAVEDVIRRDASLQAKGPGSLPRLRWLGGPVGTLLFRSGWDKDDLVGMFKVMPLFAKNHDHLDRLSFQIYCRGALALDSGLYEGAGSGYDSDHWLNYFQRTVSHNTLLIRDPAERTVYRDKPVQADGGQFYPGEGANPGGLDGITQPRFRIARVVRNVADEQNGYAVVTGDATRGYGQKAELVERTFVVVLGGEEPLKASIAIRDRVKSAEPGHEKVWMLHTMEQPERFANVVKISRTGGRNSGGVLMSATLLPQGTMPDLVGGPGAEFLVGDVNYATEKGGDAEAGAWRVEVGSAGEAGEVEFLHAMEVFSSPPVAYITDASLVTGQGMSGVETPAATVLFCEDSGAGEEYSFTTEGGSARKHVIVGLSPERTYRVGAEGREMQLTTTSAGTLIFRTELKTPWEFTIKPE